MLHAARMSVCMCTALHTCVGSASRARYSCGTMLASTWPSRLPAGTVACNSPAHMSIRSHACSDMLSCSHMTACQHAQTETQPLTAVCGCLCSAPGRVSGAYKGPACAEHRAHTFQQLELHLQHQYRVMCTIYICKHMLRMQGSKGMDVFQTISHCVRIT